MILWGVA